MENDDGEGFVSDLSIEEDNMQESQVSISKGDKVKSALSNIDSDSDNQEYLVLNPMKESFDVEMVLSSLEHSLHEAVIESVHEKQNEIFVRVSDKSSFNNSMINDNFISMSYGDNYCLSKRKQKALSPLSEDEIDQLLKGPVTAQAKVYLQCTHG